MKKQALSGILGVMVVTLACSFESIRPIKPTPVDQVGTIVAATMQALTTIPGPPAQTQTAPATSGIPVAFEYVSFLIPNGLASSVIPQAVPIVSQDSGAPWEVAPEHLNVTLAGYPLQDQFHTPGIFVYPADEFAQVNPGAAEQIGRLKKVLAGSPLLKETLPIVPFFNAGPLIAANIKLLPFQNGTGVRELTEYAQYAAPINNHELFYHFQGLTSDEKYYIIAILPITAPFLAEDEKPDAPVPPDGVPIPKDLGPNQVYYISVTEKLNSMSPDSYAPSLNILDTLIRSILVTNP